MNRKAFEECISAMISNPTFTKNYVFYSAMIAQCKIKFEEIPAPAGVAFNNTHYELYINDDIFSTFPLEQRIGILKHEMLHILNNHVQRKEEREHLPWNVSTDMAINQMIERKHLPEDGIFPEDFQMPLNETSEKYYELLKNNSQMQELKKQMEALNSQQSNGQSNEIPDHSTWQKSEGEAEIQQEITRKMIEKSIERARGNVSTNELKYLEMFKKKAQISWKKALRNLTAKKKTSSRKTIMRTDRRFPGRDDVKGNTKDTKFELIVLLDISGSMRTNDVLTGLNEIYNICKSNKTDMKIIQCDTEIKGIENYTPKMKTFKRKGTGGTYLYPGIEYVKNNKLNPDGIIVITDGYCEDVSRWKTKPKCKTIFLTTDTEVPGVSSVSKFSQYKLKAQNV